MKYKTVFTVNTIPLLIEGLGVLFVPTLLVSLFEIELQPAGVFFARFFGASMIALAWISWMARDAEDSKVLDGVIQGNILVWGLSIFIALHGYLQGTVNFMSFTTMGMGALFSVWFAYARYGKNRSINPK